jgi:integrase
MRAKRSEDLLAVGEKINGDSYIFSDIDATPWSDTKTGNGLRKAIQDSGVDMKNDWRLLRHLHATISLLIGEPIHDVSRRLGHANIQITLMHYADIISSSQRSASDNLSKVLEQVEVVI